MLGAACIWLGLGGPGDVHLCGARGGLAVGCGQALEALDGLGVEGGNG